MKKFLIRVYYRDGENKGNCKNEFYADTIEEARKIRAMYASNKSCDILNPVIKELKFSKIFNEFNYVYIEG